MKSEADTPRVSVAYEAPKPTKHVIFDTVRLKASGDHEERLFNNPFKFPNGDEKLRDIHTNMNLCGQLGTPLNFDMVMWSIVFEDFYDGDDIRKVLANLSLKFIGGWSYSDVLFKSVGSMFYPALLLTDGFSSDWITPKHEPLRKAIKKYDKAVRQIKAAVGLMARKQVWTHWYQMVDVDRKARRIESTDAMGVDVKVGLVSMSSSVEFKIGLHGLMYVGWPPK